VTCGDLAGNYSKILADTDPCVNPLGETRGIQFRINFPRKRPEFPDLGIEPKSDRLRKIVAQTQNLSELKMEFIKSSVRTENSTHFPGSAEFQFNAQYF